MQDNLLITFFNFENLFSEMKENSKIRHFSQMLIALCSRITFYLFQIILEALFGLLPPFGGHGIYGKSQTLQKLPKKPFSPHPILI